MISLIVATIGSKPEELSRLLQSLKLQSCLDFEVIIVSQDNHDSITQIIEEFELKIKHVRLKQKGLSLSRNAGIAHLSDKTTVISFPDDDCWFPDYAIQVIKEEFESEQADAVCYRIWDPIQEVYYKEYAEQEQPSLSWFNLFQKSSIELFFSYRVFQKNIRFDEHFGLGTQYTSGEENILLADIKKAGMKIKYIPETIVYHLKQQEEKTLDFHKLRSKGPLFCRMFNKVMAFFLLTVFLIKKRAISAYKLKVLDLYAELIKFKV